MRIARLKKSAREQGDVRRELHEVTKAEPVKPPVCGDHCPTYEESQCHMHCPEARFMLSSEVDYPLEAKIAPVVFELKRMGVYHPCWSCEGHDGEDGKLWKRPRVWFYAQSIIHVRLLADAMAELYINEKLNVQWEVVLTATDRDNTDTRFSLQPNLTGDDTRLGELHQDLESIAAHLRQMIIARAEELAEHTGEPEDTREDARENARENARADGRTDEKPNRRPPKLFSQLRAGGSQ